MLNQLTSPTHVMENEQTLDRLPSPDLATFPGKDQLWWPSWQSLFEDGQSLMGINPSPLLQHTHNSDRLDDNTWTPDTDLSPTDSAAVFSPSATSPGTMEPTHDGRISKRKAQNRAAYVVLKLPLQHPTNRLSSQRAHRERQRVRLNALHDKIEKLQDRCRQLQARNQLFETAFQRFFRDAVVLLGTRDNSRTVELETDNRSSDEEIFSLNTQK